MKKRVLLLAVMLVLYINIFASHYHTIPIELNGTNILKVFLTDEENFKNSFYETTGEIYNQTNFEILDCSKNCKYCLFYKMKKLLLFIKQYCWMFDKDKNGKLNVVVLKYICGIVYYSIQLL